MNVITKTDRIYFKVGTDIGPAFIERVISFDWHMGMSWRVRQRSSISMHEAIRRHEPNSEILEVSTKSTDYNLGKSLSAFNLMLKGVRVENIFQSSKVFNDGGPYLDLLNVEPSVAKKDPRIQILKSRRLTAFSFAKKIYPVEPKSFFYDYVYISALNENKYLLNDVIKYNIFTDIEFNQKVPYSETKGPFNCQARSCAICVWLIKKGLLDDYLRSPEKLIGRIYPAQARQCELFGEM